MQDGSVNVAVNRLDALPTRAHGAGDPTYVVAVLVEYMSTVLPVGDLM